MLLQDKLQDLENKMQLKIEEEEKKDLLKNFKELEKQIKKFKNMKIKINNLNNYRKQEFYLTISHLDKLKIEFSNIRFNLEQLKHNAFLTSDNYFFYSY